MRLQTIQKYKSQSIFNLFVTFLLLFCYVQAGSAPVIWEKSSFFTAGQFNCQLTIPSVLQEFNATYVTPLTRSPTKKPSLGIADIDFSFATPNVYLKLQLQSWSATGLVANLTVYFANTFTLKLNYLAPDPTMTYQYSSYSVSFAYSPAKIAPFFISTRVQMAGLTTASLDMTHDNAMLPFVHFFNLTNVDYCFDISVKTRVFNGTHYEYNISSDCTGMNMTLIGWSRIIFDKTGIQNLGYCFFEYGSIDGFNNDQGALKTTFNPLISQNFIMGLSEFKYLSLNSTMVMSFSSIIGNLTSIKTNTKFQKLVFNYWSLKYRRCPLQYPYFQSNQQLCYDQCFNRTYEVTAIQMCKECFYTCGECTSYPACTSCSSASNRYLSGTSCLPNPGYYDDGTQLAPLCKEGCLTCVSLLVCSTCDTNSFYYMVNNSCAYCNVSFGYFLNLANLQCEMCPMNCLICSSAAVCNLCNLSFNYYLNNSVCYYCNITENWFINYNIQCQKCSLIGCLTCSSLSNCSLCNTTANYYLNETTCQVCQQQLDQFINPVSLHCQQCSLVGCLDCISLEVCTSCNLNANYYLKDSICEYCNATLNWFIADSQCQQCLLVGCELCQSLTNCLVCNMSSDYFLNGTKCDYCNKSVNLFINSGSHLCEPCDLQGCLQCTSLTQCKTCDVGNLYTIANSSCVYCNSSLGYFINDTNQLCQICLLEGCLECSSLTTCSVCNTSDGYYLRNHTCQYCNISQGRFIDMQSSSCQACPIVGCVECKSKSTCAVCGEDFPKCGQLTIINQKIEQNQFNVLIITGLAVVGLLSICIICLWVFKRRKIDQQQQKKKKTYNKNRQIIQVETIPTQPQIQQSIFPIISAKKMLKLKKNKVAPE